MGAGHAKAAMDLEGAVSDRTHYASLTNTLIESFSALADEVQSLMDCKTVLEHKLRYAHEQYQALADKYAPAVPDVSETLAKLQLPPTLKPPAANPSAVVPLPRRRNSCDLQIQLALLIREGRKAARQLSSAPQEKTTSGGRRPGTGTVTASASSPGLDTTHSASTVLEYDFTVEGRRGPLSCPFSTRPKANESDGSTIGNGEKDASAMMGVHSGEAAALVAETETAVKAPPPQAPKPRHRPNEDPICAAMMAEDAALASAAPAVASKCPIRFLDRHSPEEVAQYFETHKHELPRSHEVCLRQNQKNEEQIRKLDAKYGNLVSMINGLGHLHQSMLPDAQSAAAISNAAVAAEEGKRRQEQRKQSEQGAEERSSSKRVTVEDWARTVAGNGDMDVARDGSALVEEDGRGNDERDRDRDRECRFDRPLRDVRVGESPSRPWGISVPPDYAGMAGGTSEGGETGENGHIQRRQSPPPAPVKMPILLPLQPSQEQHLVAPRDAGPALAGKCPFGHLGVGKFSPPPPTYTSDPALSKVVAEEEANHSHRQDELGEEMQDNDAGREASSMAHMNHSKGAGFSAAPLSSRATRGHDSLPSPSPREEERPAALAPATFLNVPFPEPAGPSGTRPRAPNTSKGEETGSRAGGAPQMVFNISGPVFIGYPMEQAIQFIQNVQQQRH